MNTCPRAILRGKLSANIRLAVAVKLQIYSNGMKILHAGDILGNYRFFGTKKSGVLFSKQG